MRFPPAEIYYAPLNAFNICMGVCVCVCVCINVSAIHNTHCRHSRSTDIVRHLKRHLCSQNVMCVCVVSYVGVGRCMELQQAVSVTQAFRCNLPTLAILPLTRARMWQVCIGPHDICMYVCM